MVDVEPLIRQDLEGGIVRLSLATGGGNPLSPLLLDALDAHMDDVEHDPPGALVLDGGGSKLFCGGFDLKTIIDFSRREMRTFFRHFTQVLARLTELPTPTVCAIGGHAIAGGFILPLACDFRAVVDGPIKLGLSEVDLGAAVPAGTQVLLAARTSPSIAARLSMFGSMLGPQDAADLGYADAVVDGDVNTQAVAMARALAAKPGRAATATKLLYAQPLAARVRAADVVGLEAFLDSWFSPAARERLRDLASRL